MIQNNTVKIFSDDPGIADVFLNAHQKIYQIAGVEDLSDVDLFIIDLDFKAQTPFDVCNDLKNSKTTSGKPIILLAPSSDNDLLVKCLNTGVEDYVLKPVSEVELLARADILLRPKNYYEDLEHKDLCLLLSLTEAISSTRNPMNILRRIVDTVSEVVDVARCSIISVSSDDELVVKTSSDLRPGEEVRLDLARYPEINRVLETKKSIIINDLKKDVLMESVRHHLEDVDHNSVMVVPILRQGSVIGTFLLCTASQLPDGITDRIYKLTQMIANLSAGALENAILLQSVRDSQKYFEEMSIRDGLTNLYNHRHLHTRIEEEFQRSKRHKSDLSCVFMDLDNFKDINDRHGHLFGDEVLKKVGLAILDVLRETDFAARYGGDEFCMLLPNTDSTGAKEVMQRLEETLSERLFSSLLPEPIVASIGYASVDQAEISSARDLLQKADEAMYLEKEKRKIEREEETNVSAGVS